MKAILSFAVCALIAGCAHSPPRQLAPLVATAADGHKTVKCNKNVPDIGFAGFLPGAQAAAEIAGLAEQNKCKSEAMDKGYDVIEDSQ